MRKKNMQYIQKKKKRKNEKLTQVQHWEINILTEAQ